ncbi:MAG: class I SAM-dependent methyltransferase [Betaproteobacteria bacterium]|nr:class I SAM-dependent methyltransferase [Betaproteobacteria bacterium]
MKIVLNWVLAWLAAITPALAQEGRGDVVYVPTPQIVVEEMLRMAKVGPNDYIIDLGSGDGRIVITAAKKFGARGFGVDLDPDLLKMSREAARKEGVADRAMFYERNLFETDLSAATVITSYLLPEMNLKLRPKIFALRPGTRVVAHDYHMDEWYPDEEKTMIVPEKEVGDPGKSYVYLWIVPARVAGKWQSQLALRGKPAPYEFELRQTFQKIDGTARVGSQTVKLQGGRLSGEQISFTLTARVDGAMLRHNFRGRARSGAIEGTVTIGEGAKQYQVPWSAKQTVFGEMQTSGLAPLPLAAR